MASSRRSSCSHETEGAKLNPAAATEQALVYQPGPDDKRQDKAPADNMAGNIAGTPAPIE